MGLLDSLRGQFVDVIEHVDDEGTTLVTKYERPGDEIKQGSQVIVREGQCAVFMKGGALADIMGPGTFTLTTENLPLLSTLAAFKHAFNSPVKADLYFVNTRQFVDNAWGTRNPIMMRDPDLGMIRVRAFGRFAFRIEDVVQFSREVLAARKLFSTTDIVSYLASIIGESVATTLAKSGVSALDFAMGYREHGARVAEEASRTSSSFGIRFTNVVVENASLPDEVEQLIDEQSGIALARKDMASFLEYQNARALRDAAKQEGGLAGLGAGAALGGIMAERLSSASPPVAQGGRARRHRPNRPGFARAESARRRRNPVARGIRGKEEAPSGTLTHRSDRIVFIRKEPHHGKEGRIDVPKPQRRACRAVLSTHHLDQPFPIARTATEKADAQMGQDRRHRLRGARPHRRRVHVRQEGRHGEHRTKHSHEVGSQEDRRFLEGNQRGAEAPVFPKRQRRRKRPKHVHRQRQTQRFPAAPTRSAPRFPQASTTSWVPAISPILKDSSGTLDAIIANDNFSGNSIVDLADGQYFQLKGASMYPIEFYDPIEKTEFKDGMYRVGIDMPAGEYKVTSSSGSGTSKSPPTRAIRSAPSSRTTS